MSLYLNYARTVHSKAWMLLKILIIKNPSKLLIFYKYICVAGSSTKANMGRRCFQTKSLEILIVNLMINNESSSISFERSGRDNERQGLSRRCGMGTCYRAYALHWRRYQKILLVR